MSNPWYALDTEGSPILKEVAVVNESGELIYEAYTDSSQHNKGLAQTKPLFQILSDLRGILKEALIVVHNLEHEKNIFRSSFQEVGLRFPDWNFVCTVDLGKKTFPTLSGFSLEQLSRDLNLGDERFDPKLAHAASYDALYTYYLYRRIQLEKYRLVLAQSSNPFSSSRVDDPFQTFADDRDIYSSQFKKFKSLLKEIPQDHNNQSKGVVLIGEAGSGKTHLMMRLTQDVISKNRILFIRQPNNAISIFHHIYSMILESFTETVDEQGTTQLDLLLIRSIRNVIEAIPSSERTQKDHDILNALISESLDALGGNTTQIKRERWKRIEKHVLDWWAQHFSLAGHRTYIIQGLLRFCRYTSPKHREIFRRWLTTGEISAQDSHQFGLPKWFESADREEFALQAIQTFGELSTLDQPLVLVFDQLEGLWRPSREDILMQFGECLKELFTHLPNTLIIVTLFPDRWGRFKEQFDGSITERVSQHILILETPTQDQLLNIVNTRLAAYGVNAHEIFDASDIQTIIKQPSIRHCLNKAQSFYSHHIFDEPLPKDADYIPRLPQQRESELEERIGLVERKLESLTTLLTEVLQGESSNVPSRSNETFVSKLGAIESYVPIKVSGNSSAFERYLAAQTDTLRTYFQRPRFISDSDDCGKLRMICDAFKCIKSISLLNDYRLGTSKLPEHLIIEDHKSKRFIGFLNIAHLGSVNARLKNLNQLVHRYPDTAFILIRDYSFDPIQSRGAGYQLECFKAARENMRHTTHFQTLDLQQRVEFELVNRIITDVENRDLEYKMTEALSLLVEHHPYNWIVKLLVRSD